jgi:hypothetical protein
MKQILFIAAVLLLAAGCKKDEDQPDRTPMLLGIWDATFQGFDINRNSVLDDNETHNAPPSNSLQFNADGTGTITDSTYNGNFNWAFTDNQQFLELRRSSDTIRFEVRSLSEMDLLLIQLRNQFDYYRLYHKK